MAKNKNIKKPKKEPVEPVKKKTILSSEKTFWDFFDDNKNYSCPYGFSIADCESLKEHQNHQDYEALLTDANTPSRMLAGLVTKINSQEHVEMILNRPDFYEKHQVEITKRVCWDWESKPFEKVIKLNDTKVKITTTRKELILLKENLSFKALSYVKDTYIGYDGEILAFLNQKRLTDKLAIETLHENYYGNLNGTLLKCFKEFGNNSMKTAAFLIESNIEGTDYNALSSKQLVTDTRTLLHYTAKNPAEGMEMIESLSASFTGSLNEFQEIIRNLF